MILEVLRPSRIKTFFDCPYRWYRDNIYKPIRSVGYSAHLGSAIHKSAQTYYDECITHNKWENVSKELSGVAIDEWRNKCKEDTPVDIKEINVNEIEKYISIESLNYCHNAKQLSQNVIPISVEKTYKVEFTSKSVNRLEGTLDIVYNDSIADIKTMSRVKKATHYILQQLAYAILRQRNGENVTDLYIHKVIKNVKATRFENESIMECLGEYDLNLYIKKMENLIKQIIKTCEEFEKTGNELLFRGNCQSTLCNSKFCPYFKECKFKI